MAWPTDDLTTTDTDQGTDNPSIARAMINTLLLRVKDIIGSRGAVNGVCDLDASSKVPVGRLPVGTAASDVAVGNHGHLTSAITGLDAALAAKAPLSSPSLTDIPTAPTAPLATNTTQIATTAFVLANVVSSTELGAIGTYAQLAKATVNSSIVAGSAYAGSGLRYDGHFRSGLGSVVSLNAQTVGATPTGTWRAMGEAAAYATGYSSALFVRIS